MIFYLHYLAQTGIIRFHGYYCTMPNIVKLTVLKIILPIDVDKLANTLESMMYHFYLSEYCYSGLSV